MTSTLTERLDAMKQALAGLRGGSLTAHAFSSAARSETDLLAALPPRYSEVLGGLLDRLETSALFTEESCSFSQGDLVDSMQLWIDKAEALLASS